MAERKLNHGRESTQELLTHHLQYEIDILRWTFVRLHNRTLD
jgi:hypothetical protein